MTKTERRQVSILMTSADFERWLVNPTPPRLGLGI
jgi:hypothetical protein